MEVKSLAKKRDMQTRLEQLTSTQRLCYTRKNSRCMTIMRFYFKVPKNKVLSTNPIHKQINTLIDFKLNFSKAWILHCCIDSIYCTLKKIM